MTKRAGFLLLAAAAAGLFVLQAADYKGPHAERDQKDVLQLESEWTQAIQNADTETLDRLLAPEYTMVDASGNSVGKAQEIAMYKTGEVKFDSISTTGQKVIIYIGGAVVTGTSIIKGKHKKDDISGTYRFVDIIERRPAGWQAVYSQITKVETANKKK
jgi:ketosteroid isomerase-like protein